MLRHTLVLIATLGTVGTLQAVLSAQQRDAAVGVVRPLQYRSPAFSNESAALRVVLEHPVSVPGSSFLTFELSELQLHGDSVLEIESSADGDVQVWTLDRWKRDGPHTGYFNGDRVLFRLWSAPGAKNDRFGIRSVGSSDPTRTPLTLCGADDRKSGYGPAIGRVLVKKRAGIFVGTCFLISPKNCLATAGHVIEPPFESVAVHFNVPLSDASGGVRVPALNAQYDMDTRPSWRAFEFFDPGPDWGVFHILPNAKTGLHAGRAQGSHYEWGAPPSFNATLEVIGYGHDLTPPTYNYTLQTSTGPFRGQQGSQLRHRVDSEGGNSGSPIIDVLARKVIGVHTRGGCDATSTTSNSGTIASHAPFAAARARMCPAKPDFVIRPLTGPAKLLIGNAFGVRPWIENLGTVGAPACEVRLEMSETADFKVAVEVGKLVLPALRAGGFARQTIPGKVPDTFREGVCYLRIVVDPQDLVDEVDETDNIVTFKTFCEKGKADLYIVSFTVPNVSFRGGDLVEIDVNVANRGNAVAPSTHCGILVHGHAGGPRPEDLYIGGFETGPLAPNQSVRVKQSYRIPVCLPSDKTGSRLIGALADMLSSVSESNETNNWLQAGRTFAYPSGDTLAVEWISRPENIVDSRQTGLLAELSAAKGQRVGMRLRVTPTSHQLGTYIMLLSGRPSVPIVVDEFTMFGLSLINHSPFPAWLGTTTVQRQMSFGLPPFQLPSTVSVFTHCLFFDRSLSYLGATKSSIELRLKP